MAGFYYPGRCWNPIVSISPRNVLPPRRSDPDTHLPAGYPIHRQTLPRKMLDEIGIDKEMVLAAQDSMIQVWDARVYEEVAISGEELGMMAVRNF